MSAPAGYTLHFVPRGTWKSTCHIYSFETGKTLCGYVPPKWETEHKTPIAMSDTERWHVTCKRCEASYAHKVIGGDV